MYVCLLYSYMNGITMQGIMLCIVDIDCQTKKINKQTNKTFTGKYSFQL